MIGALAKAVGQAGDPAFLRVLLMSVTIAALCFVGLAGGVGWALHHALARQGWLADAVAALGSVGSLLLALWLFLPVATAIATLFLEPVCRAVERRWYPGLPPARGASVMAQAGDGLALAVRLVVLSLIGLVVALLVPGVGLLIGWAINGWATGRGLFAAVAMRRMTRGAALSLYAGERGAVLSGGVVLAVASSVPLLNLLVPVIGTAAMVHLVERARSSSRRAVRVLE